VRVLAQCNHSKRSRSSPSGFNFTSNAEVSDGKWHYVVATRLADGTGQIYIDGLLDSQQ
jgi:hypothetical protein